MTNGDWAVYWATEYGFEIVPDFGIRRPGVCECARGAECPSPGKHPRASGWQETASSDPDVVREMFGAYPLANVAMLVPYGMFVLDVEADGLKSLEKWEDKHGELLTLWNRSGGGGLHGFFRARGKLHRSLAGYPNIEIKPPMSKVTLPGSTHASGGVYEVVELGAGIRPAPVRLLHRLQKPVRTFPAPKPLKIDGNRAYVEKALTEEVQRVIAAPEGQRNHTLNEAGFAVARFVAQGLLEKAATERLLMHAALKCGLERHEIRSTIRSAFRARGVA